MIRLFSKTMVALGGCVSASVCRHVVEKLYMIASHEVDKIGDL